jgi:lysophospholipase L1-like esterase
MTLPEAARWPLRVTTNALGVLVAMCVLVSGCQRTTADGKNGFSWSHLTHTSSTSPASPGPSNALPPATVVALGDSYSAGEGNGPYDADAPGCDRGAGAWPRLLGHRTAGSTVTILACSGARTSAFGQSYRGQPAQLAALRSLVASGAKPSVVTITIGGNDAGFGSTLLSCVVFKCFWSGNDSAAVRYAEDTLPGLLTSVYSQVKAAVPNARVIVVGYPDLIPSWGETNGCSWLNASNRSQLSSLNSDVNRAAQRSARSAGVDFVSLDQVFRGHELCTSDSWLYPVGLGGAGLDASAHPNSLGQQAIADAVYSYLSQRSR